MRLTITDMFGWLGSRLGTSEGDRVVYKHTMRYWVDYKVQLTGHSASATRTTIPCISLSKTINHGVNLQPAKLGVAGQTQSLQCRLTRWQAWPDKSIVVILNHWQTMHSKYSNSKQSITSCWVVSDSWSHSPHRTELWGLTQIPRVAHFLLRHQPGATSVPDPLSAHLILIE